MEEPKRKRKRKPKAISPEPPPIRSLDDSLKSAKDSNKYMVAVFWVDGETIHLERHCQVFNIADFDSCVGLLHTDLQKETNGGK